MIGIGIILHFNLTVKSRSISSWEKSKIGGREWMGGPSIIGVVSCCKNFRWHKVFCFWKDINCINCCSSQLLYSIRPSFLELGLSLKKIIFKVKECAQFLTSIKVLKLLNLLVGEKPRPFDSTKSCGCERMTLDRLTTGVLEIILSVFSMDIFSSSFSPLSLGSFFGGTSVLGYI